MNIQFKPISRGFLAAIFTAAVGTAVAADQPVDVGKFEYEGACASCHGVEGKGNGPVAMLISIRIPDLTSLAKANNGIFPFDRVFKVIDGREEVKAHGPRDMPVWGRAFNRQSSAFFENYPAHDNESAARSRILALTEYLYRIQGK